MPDPVHNCRSIACPNMVVPDDDYCYDCTVRRNNKDPQSMSGKYPQYYKDVAELTEVDVYQVHHLFEIEDPAGCIQHASKKLLLSGVRTGGKSKYQDIKEARDTLNRWLELNHS